MAKEQITLTEGFLENIAGMDEQDLLNAVFDTLKSIEKTKEDKKNDDKLNAARQIAKDLSKGYTAVINLDKEKLRHMMERLQDLRARQDLRAKGIKV